MSRQPARVELPLIVLERGAGDSLQKQLFESIRKAILNGILPPGRNLPSTRLLARELGISRNTALWTYEQLSAEGYLETHPKSGTRVADFLPDHFLKPAQLISSHEARPVRKRTRSQTRNLRISVRDSREYLTPFAPGSPEVDQSFRQLWTRLSTRQHKSGTRELYDYGFPEGYLPLRRKIVAYLAETRGVLCDPEQVIIVSATQQAFSLVLRTVLKRFDAAGLEEPGHIGFRSSCAINEIHCRPVPVDQDGLVVTELKPDLRLVCVSPSCQYPTGAMLSLERRFALLAWAQRYKSWILEYDYVSTFRYPSRPLLSLQGLDRAGRVLYVGTFTETLFPSLRIAYLVVPQSMIQPFATAHAVLHGFPPLLQQATLARFMEDGHLASHVRRMRKIYSERRQTMLEALDSMAVKLAVGATDAALHVLIQIGSRHSDVEIAAKAHRVGLQLAPLSQLYGGKAKSQGFLLGYAAFTPNLIKSGIRKFEAVLNEYTGRGKIGR